MRKYLILILIPFLFNTQSFAQSSEEILREVFLDGEFFLYEEEYADALPSYLRLHKRGFQDNANINYRIGICYLNIPGDKDKSIPYLEKAVEKVSSSYKEGVFRQDKAPYDTYIFLGNAYRINNQLDKAIEAYEKYKQLLEAKDLAEIAYANTQIESVKNAQKMQSNPIPLRWENLGETINSSTSNFKAVLSGDGNSILYMNELPFYDAVYYSIKENGEWSKPTNITPEIQSDGDQYISSISFDGKSILLSREDNFNSDIWISYLQDNNRWSVSVPLNKEINTKYWESHACMNADGSKLYFASNRRDGLGEMDIYISLKDEDGEWGEPKNLGNIINTNLNEDTPFITADGKRLYFSSQGHYNIGGYDIFYSELKQDGSWSEPVNVGYPLNTTDDDLFYFPGKDYNTGYVARYEDDSYGKDDIYKVTILTGEEEVPILAREETKPIEELETEIEEDAEQAIEEAEEVIEPPKELVEKVEPSKPEVLEPEETFEQEVLEIRPIFFDFNSVELANDAINELDYLISVLNDHESTYVQLIGHTDAKGPVEINKIISLNRAKAAREYLIRNGISPYRIKIFGMGKSQFIAKNENPDGTDNPEGRHYNRRVEIKILNVDESIKIIEKISVPEHLRVEQL